MSCRALRFISFLLVSSLAVQANHAGRHKSTGFMNLKMDASELSGNLQQAMAEGLSLDHDTDFVQHDKIAEWMAPTFKALPKNARGLVELQVMEHAIHRYFMHKYSLSLRPFEPHRPLNASELRSPEVLGSRAPAFIEEILKGRFYHNGFSLEDAVSMIATLEHFLYDDSVRRLRAAYKERGFEEDASLEVWDAQQAILAFIKLIDEEGEQTVVVDGHFADYRTRDFIRGELDRIHYKRQKSGRGKWMLSETFTFKDVAHAAHAVVLAASELFSDCESLREHMITFDKKVTGRAKLSELYFGFSSSETKSALGGDTTGFQFGESKDWLQRMGVLDETNGWKGPQVIIPNYIQAASNCVMSTSLFRQCCPNNQCQRTFHQLESMLGKPESTAMEIWPAIAEATQHELQYETAMENLQQVMMKLGEVGEHHGGNIPIHGRLFAQWMHYLQPQECPYPYKKGQVEVITPKDCGKDCVVDGKQQHEHANAPSDWMEESYLPDDQGVHDWLGQWVMEEELIFAPMPPAAPESDLWTRVIALAKAVILVAAFFCLAGLAIFRVSSEGTSKGRTVSWSPQVSWGKKSDAILKMHSV